MPKTSGLRLSRVMIRHPGGVQPAATLQERESAVPAGGRPSDGIKMMWSGLASTRVHQGLSFQVPFTHYFVWIISLTSFLAVR